MQRRTTERHGFRFVKDNKLRHALGETNFDKKTVRINVKKHRQVKRAKPGAYGVSKKHATIITTLMHEQGHIDNPKASERTVEKNARARVARMSNSAKQRMYNKLKRK